nr:MAG TPA: hypothetical protein [Caudoviricetes sp.]
MHKYSFNTKKAADKLSDLLPFFITHIIKLDNFYI